MILISRLGRYIHLGSLDCSEAIKSRRWVIVGRAEVVQLLVLQVDGASCTNVDEESEEDDNPTSR